MTPLLALALLAGAVPGAPGDPTPKPFGSATGTPVPVVDNGGNNGAGGIAFLVVLLLLAVSVGLFLAMRGSLRRLRENQATGGFRGEDPRPPGRQSRPPGRQSPPPGR